MKKVFPFILILNFLFADLLKPENATNLSTIHILFEWEQEPNAIGYNIQISGDEVFENQGVKIVVDPKSLVYLKGTQMDYVKQGVNEGFEFKNPNAKGECGCGESFSV